MEFVEENENEIVEENVEESPVLVEPAPDLETPVTPAPKKRGRGRPRKVVVEVEPRRRGRPPKIAETAPAPKRARAEPPTQPTIDYMELTRHLAHHLADSKNTRRQQRLDSWSQFLV